MFRTVAYALLPRDQRVQMSAHLSYASVAAVAAHGAAPRRPSTVKDEWCGASCATRHLTKRDVGPLALANGASLVSMGGRSGPFIHTRGTSA